MIDLVGIEIEGSWDEDPPCGEIVHDGSVYVNDVNSRCETHPGPATNGIGEVVSPPMEVDEVATWVHQNYPDEVNETCGLHIHISMDHKRYQHLMDSQWYEHFKQAMRTWGGNNRDRLPKTFFDRFEGETDWARRYCRDLFEPDKQIRRGGGPGRYTQWNYQAFRAHGTVECRFLPAFGVSPDAVPRESATDGDSGLAVDAIHTIIDIIENYLEQDNKQDVFAFSVSPDPREEETIEQ